MTGTPDPYKVLQVDSEAEDEVIQAAYRRLAQKYHPDVATGPDAGDRMAAINAAWEILRDPSRRAALDLGRRLAARNEEQLVQNLGAVGWNLTSEQVSKLDAASKVDPVYPYWHQDLFDERNPPPVSRG